PDPYECRSSAGVRKAYYRGRHVGGPGGSVMRSRVLAVLAVVVLIISIALPVHAAQGGRGGGGHMGGGHGGHMNGHSSHHHHGGCCWWGGAAGCGACAVGAGLTSRYFETGTVGFTEC